MEREIELFVGVTRYQFREDTIHELALKCIDFLEDLFPSGDVSIALLSNKRIAELHKEYLEDPTTTDVITFPGDPELLFAGEVCVSVDKAFESCEEHDYTPSQELVLYIVHGLLHLAGKLDKTESDIQEMRKWEKLAMEHLELNPKLKLVWRSSLL